MKRREATKGLVIAPFALLSMGGMAAPGDTREGVYEKIHACLEEMGIYKTIHTDGKYWWSDKIEYKIPPELSKYTIKYFIKHKTTCFSSNEYWLWVLLTHPPMSDRELIFKSPIIVKKNGKPVVILWAIVE